MDKELSITDSDLISIYYAADHKLFPQLLMSVLSIVEHTERPLRIINLTVECKEVSAKSKMTTQEETALLDKIVKDKNSNSSFITIDTSNEFREHLLPSVNNPNKFYSYFVVGRLVAHLIPQIPDKVIYLDTDVLAKGDIGELWDIDNTNWEFMGRRDAWRVSKYLQSGVMLFNMKKIRESGSMEKACQLVRNKKYITYIDMSALNTSMRKSKKVISKKYNSYKNNDCILFHACDVRKSRNILNIKKFMHRIKTDEYDLFLQKCPNFLSLVQKTQSFLKSINY